MEALTLNHTIYPKPPLLHCSFKPNFCPTNSGFHTSYLKRSLSCTTTCRLKTPPQGNRKNDGNYIANKKIILSEQVPPPLVEEEGGRENGSEEVSGETGKKMSGVMGLVKRFPRKVLSVLSYLPLALGEMFAIAALMAVGTAIVQGEAPEFYFQKYPEDNPVLGFFTWRWVLTLGFDHMYSSPIFLASLVLLAASLMACTYTTQIPIVKVAKRFRFL